MSIQPIEGKILDYFDDSDLSTAFDTRLQTLWDHLSPYERDAIHHIEQAMFPDDTLTRQRSTQALLLLKFWQAEVDLTNELEANFKS